MKNIHFKSLIISALIVWTLGVLSYLASYFVSIMDDPDLQANWVLSLAIIPLAGLGAHLYYRKGYQTNGFVLGGAMFLIAMIMDALVTVPVFMIPNGGSYASFFIDFGFWMLAIEYISVVAAYWQIENTLRKMQLRRAAKAK